jgi:Helix-turn-helix
MPPENILFWDNTIFGFSGLPVLDPAASIDSLFPDLYDRCLAGLIEARKEAEITQTELAAQLQRPQSFVAKYEERERRLDIAEYVTIARALGADPYKLLRIAERS